MVFNLGLRVRPLPLFAHAYLHFLREQFIFEIACFCANRRPQQTARDQDQTVKKF